MNAHPDAATITLRRFLRLLLMLLSGVMLTLVAAPAASAHPLGNFTVNSFSALRIGPDKVAVEVIVDSAEIPTVQQFPEANENAGISLGRAQAYADAECARLRPGLDLTIGGRAVAVRLVSGSLRLTPGQGGLHTMRLACRLATIGSVPTVGQRLTYVDQNSLDRTGWREVIDSGAGVALSASSVPETSVSNRLSRYPQDLLTSPLDVQRATARVVAGSGTGGAETLSDSSTPGTANAGWIVETFTQLVAAKELSIGFAILALLIAVALGALHAFSPGHGKTLMAAYLLGQRSSLREVAIIGATVTITHTLGVLVLGLVLSGLALTAPTAIYAWLGLASGVLLIGIGVSLLRQARHRAAHLSHAPERVAELVHAGAESAQTRVDDPHKHPHEHGHEHGHGHGHHDDGLAHPESLTHSHGWGGTHTHPPVATSARGMIAVGFAGGMVPSPSALIVLLGGIALGRAWFGAAGDRLRHRHGTGTDRRGTRALTRPGPTPALGRRSPDNRPVLVRAQGDTHPPLGDLRAGRRGRSRRRHPIGAEALNQPLRLGDPPPTRADGPFQTAAPRSPTGWPTVRSHGETASGPSTTPRPTPADPPPAPDPTSVLRLHPLLHRHMSRGVWRERAGSAGTSALLE